MVNVTPGGLMPILSNIFYTMAGIRRPDVYVETGMYRGDSLRRVVGKFESVYAIELDLGWYEFNKKYFSIYENFHLIHGNSGIKLNEIPFTNELGYMIFLDAHYSGPGTAIGEQETPLLEELTTLKYLISQHCTVVIDDARQLGTASHQSGNGFSYLPFESDWSRVTLNLIKSILPNDFRFLFNKNRWISDGAKDQLICFQSPAWRMKLVELYDSLTILHWLGITSRHGLVRRIRKMVS